MVGMSTLLETLDAFDLLPEAVALRELSYQGLGDTVVDVGCGAGRAAGELAALGVTAIGVDLDPEMIAVARSRWSAARFEVGDATALPLDDGSVTGYRADKVLHILEDPALAVAEARRVLAPGGRATLLSHDWDAIIVDSDDGPRTRNVVHARADALPSPRAARGYRNLLLDGGFTDVTLEVRTIVFTGHTGLPMLSRMNDDDWYADQVARAERDRLLVAVPVFVASGLRG
jgi:SAM-dependent methyltransferase